MTPMNIAPYILADDERAALDTLCGEVFSTRSFVDRSGFRADHEELRAPIQRLCTLRYVSEENLELFRPTILGLKEYDTEESRQVLDTGTRLLELLRVRYRDRTLRKQNFLLNEIAIEFGMEREQLNFSLMLLPDLLSCATSGRTGDLRQDDAWLLPAEGVYDYKTSDAIVSVYAGWRDQALNTVPFGALVQENPFVLTKQQAKPLFEPELLAALPKEFGTLISEIETARSNKLTCLMMMGLRAIIDAYTNDRVGDKGAFAQKIALMSDEKLLNKNQAEILSSALDVGHATMHRLHVPSEEQCEQVLNIVAHLLHETYVLAPSAARLREGTPQRHKSE